MCNSLEEYIPGAETVPSVCWGTESSFSRNCSSAGRSTDSFTVGLVGTARTDNTKHLSVND